MAYSGAMVARLRDYRYLKSTPPFFFLPSTTFGYTSTLADGSECLFDVYEAKIIWDRKVRPVVIAEMDADPLVGMELLQGYELKMQVKPKGKVTIKRLPKK